MTTRARQLKPMRLVPAGHPALSGVALQVVEPGESGDLGVLAERLVLTSKRFHGLAVAAPQVGRSIALVGCADGFSIANPSLAEQAGKQVGPEGCLTFPGRWWQVERHNRVTVTGFDPHTWKPVALEATALDARMWQHEIDHLDGLLLLDRFEEITEKRRAARA